MRDYKQGKIYTIRCKYDDSLIYVGSTVERLCVRMARHRAHSKRDECINIPLYQEVNKTNWDNWFMELYQDYPCENKEQLNKREGQIIREIGTLNKQIAGRSQQEYYRDNFEQMQQYQKQYRQDNFDKLREKKKQYYQENAAYINEKNKQYNCENAEKIKERKKQYYQDNAEKIKEYRIDNSERIKERDRQYYRDNAERRNAYKREKITCECGSTIVRGGFARHKRSDKHAKNMEKN